jgi:hypothetical protein
MFPIFNPASSAVSMLSIWKPVCVAIAIFVSLRAVGLVALVFSGIAAGHIFCLRHNFKVLWINTAGHLAKMVDNKPFPNWTFEKSVGGAVCSHELSEREETVSIRGNASHPNPSSGIRLRGNVGHESFGYAWSSHVTPFKSHRLGLRVSGQDVAARFYFLITPCEVQAWR